MPLLERSWLDADTTAGTDRALRSSPKAMWAAPSPTGREADALTLAREWQALFGDRYYLELQRLGRADDEIHWSPRAVALSQKTGIPVVATNDVRFLAASDFESHEARVCISEGAQLADPAARAATPRRSTCVRPRRWRGSLPTSRKRCTTPWRSRGAARCRSSSASRACRTIRCPKA